MNQLKALLMAHPEGIRRAEIARRLGVHRSTAGRYIDQLSITSPIWERDRRVGLNIDEDDNDELLFDVYEGAFILLLFRLYQQELNIKNPHAASFLRKLSKMYRADVPVLYDRLMSTAEVLETGEQGYSSGYNEHFEKIAEASANGLPVKICYVHKATGERCNSIFKPHSFFTSRNKETEVGVRGICCRTGEGCSLLLNGFSDIEILSGKTDGVFLPGNNFCPISGYALDSRPGGAVEIEDEYNIRESNHRIKNSLFMAAGLIDITFADIRDESTTEKAMALQGRINAIAEVHALLSENDGTGYICLESYLEKLVWKNITALTPNPGHVKTKLRIDNIRLDASKALPLGMIVSEFITNSVKYCKQKDSFLIGLSVTKRDGKLSLRYSDGEDKAQLENLDSGTGSKLVNGFCKQLSADITYKNRHILLEFPV